VTFFLNQNQGKFKSKYGKYLWSNWQN